MLILYAKTTLSRKVFRACDHDIRSECVRSIQPPELTTANQIMFVVSEIVFLLSIATTLETCIAENTCKECSHLFYYSQLRAQLPRF